jgi:hypothetical protein
LLGTANLAEVRVLQGQQEHSFYIPAAPVEAVRRYIGFCSTEGEIHELEVSLHKTGNFSIDDIQIGRHTPEPDSLLMLSFCMMWFGRRRKSAC